MIYLIISTIFVFVIFSLFIWGMKGFEKQVKDLKLDLHIQEHKLTALNNYVNDMLKYQESEIREIRKMVGRINEKISELSEDIEVQENYEFNVI